MNPNSDLRTTLVTGASSGIGLHLAREFAKNGHSLVLVAPVLSELEQVATQIQREFSVGVQPLAADLATEEGPQSVYERTVGRGLDVHILVNNAGLGQRGKFWENPPERDITMIRLNAEAMVRMTRLFLPPMLARSMGRILNTASIAGFEPGPLLAVYHATKAFVLSFSESLAEELKNTGVTLTALCPGPTDTDFFPKAEMVDTKAFQKSNLMAPQDVARAAYEATMSGERVIVPGAMNKILVAGRRLMPEAMQAKKNEAMYAETNPSERKRERGDKEQQAAAEELRSENLGKRH
ncbi:MAG TPA: SDR family oxidoreductase [Opitutaceae bacterium]|nr:SDR family oxidoreductase [Opitutaceae bacterium]